MYDPLIANGTYKIMNVKYTNYAVDLIHANPLGTVSGYTDDNHSANNKWRVLNVGWHGNQIILESVVAPGYFVDAHIQRSGVPLSGFPNPAIWTVHRVAENKFQLKTTDGKYVWVLPENRDCLAILLRPDNQEDNAKWSFRRL